MTDADLALIQKIAAYTFTPVKLGGGTYVAIGHAQYLRELARRALGLPRTMQTDKLENPHD